VSLAGTWMQGVAQSWLIYRLTHSESMMGITIFATHIPVLLLGAIGGVAADRYPRKNIVLITQSLALVQAVLLATLTYTGQITPSLILVLAVLLGITNAFDIPGRHTLFVQMVGKQDLISAISLNSAVFNVSRIIGPSIAGIIVAAFGETVCFTINAFSYLAMIVCLLRMHLPKDSIAVEHKGSALADGFRYAWNHREMRVLLAVSGILNLSYAPVLSLGPFFADAIFHQGSLGLGFLVGSMGVGAVIGVLELARHKGILELPAVIRSSMLTMGAALLAFAISPYFGLSMALMVVMGFSVMRQNAAGNSLIQTTVPDAFRGRMLALYTMVVTGLLPLGSLAGGFAAERFGPRPVVLVAGFFCLAGGMMFRAAVPAFERWVKQQEEICVAAS
jgi:MFS family permease